VNDVLLHHHSENSESLRATVGLFFLPLPTQHKHTQMSGSCADALPRVKQDALALLSFYKVREGVKHTLCEVCDHGDTTQKMFGDEQPYSSC
jgi:hypothetical protein